MKRVLIAILLISLTFTVFSCSKVNDKSSTMDQEVSSKDDFTEIKFEPDKKDLPSEEDLMKLKVGMTYKEATELIGHPQYDPFSGLPGVLYESEGKVSATARFAQNENKDLYIYWLVFFDRNFGIDYEPYKEVIPSEKELNKIKVGMTYDEITKAVGFPQENPFSRRTPAALYRSTGDTYAVVIFEKDDPNLKYYAPNLRVKSVEFKKD